MKWLLTKLRDLSRGYTEQDARMLCVKLQIAKTMRPGTLVELTAGEYKAMRAADRAALP